MTQLWKIEAKSPYSAAASSAAPLKRDLCLSVVIPRSTFHRCQWVASYRRFTPILSRWTGVN